MKPKAISYLGPAGTYSELAAKQYCPQVEAIACDSLAEVFRAVINGKTDLGIVPLENIIQGPITETLDLLLKHHKEAHICDSFLLHINHGLGVLSIGQDSLDSIARVYSHEQALQQCSQFLDVELPRTERISVASTSAAIDSVNHQANVTFAAIAPPETLVAKGLKILRQDISNVIGNKTRFVVLKPGQTDVSVESSSLASTTSIVIQPGRDRQGLLFEILRIISIDHGLNLISIHSRPDSVGGFVFHMTLEGGPGSRSIQDCIASLNNYCESETSETTKVLVLGNYKHQAFAPPVFKSIGIIGGHGRMGSFFADFFSKAGISVQLYDQVGTASLEEVVKGSDVILLSLPMSATEETLKKLLPLLRPGQLLVENCSIKSSSLPYITSNINKDVEVLGIHTLFGNKISSLHDEGVVITKTEFSRNKALALEDLFYKNGARIIYSCAKEHDQTTAITQSLTQLILIALAETIAEIGHSPQQLLDFSTPNFRRILESLTRTLDQSKELLTDLQLLNIEAQQVRSKYLEIISRLIENINAGDSKQIIASLEKASNFFKN